MVLVKHCLAFALADCITRGNPATLIALEEEHDEFFQAEAFCSFERAV